MCAQNCDVHVLEGMTLLRGLTSPVLHSCHSPFLARCTCMNQSNQLCCQLALCSRRVHCEYVCVAQLKQATPILQAISRREVLTYRIQSIKTTVEVCLAVMKFDASLLYVSVCKSGEVTISPWWVLLIPLAVSCTLLSHVICGTFAKDHMQAVS